MVSRGISESIVWNLAGELIAISFLVLLTSLVLGKGQARLRMGVRLLRSSELATLPGWRISLMSCFAGTPLSVAAGAFSALS
jgi:uncharacterized membrane protein